MATPLPAPPPPPWTVTVVLPKVHPLMLLPAAVIAALLLPLLTALYAATVAAWMVTGLTWPLIGLLFRALTAITNYHPEVTR